MAEDVAKEAGGDAPGGGLEGNQPGAFRLFQANGDIAPAEETVAQDDEVARGGAGREVAWSEVGGRHNTAALSQLSPQLPQRSAEVARGGMPGGSARAARGGMPGGSARVARGGMPGGSARAARGRMPRGGTGRTVAAPDDTARIHQKILCINPFHN